MYVSCKDHVVVSVWWLRGEIMLEMRSRWKPLGSSQEKWDGIVECSWGKNWITTMCSLFIIKTQRVHKLLSFLANTEQHNPQHKQLALCSVVYTLFVLMVLLCRVRFSMLLFGCVRPCVSSMHSFYPLQCMCAVRCIGSGNRWCSNHAKTSIFSIWFFLPASAKTQQEEELLHMFSLTHIPSSLVGTLSINACAHEAIVILSFASVFLSIGTLCALCILPAHWYTVVGCQYKPHNRFSHVNEHRSELVSFRPKKKQAKSISCCNSIQS